MTFNTHNPLGSVDDRDVQDNAANLDLAVNSLSQTFVDRFGVTRDTLEGVYQKSAYYRAGTFDAGYTLTNNRQTLAYGNVEYSWFGAFPKVVAAGATPATSGGIGAGAWVDRTDVIVIASVAEVGKVSAFARISAPSGYLKCNGAAISRTTYSALFAAIGTTFGLGDGSTTFNIPDLRGEFIRGWDDARGIDTSRVFGSWQDNQNLSHTHTATVTGGSHTHSWSGTTSSNSHSHTYTKNSSTFTSQASGSSYASTWYGSATGTTSDDAHTHTVSGTTGSDSHVHTVTNAESGGTEVRVRNRALLYCIKY